MYPLLLRDKQHPPLLPCVWYQQVHGMKGRVKPLTNLYSVTFLYTAHITYFQPVSTEQTLLQLTMHREQSSIDGMITSGLSQRFTHTHTNRQIFPQERRTVFVLTHSFYTLIAPRTTLTSPPHHTSMPGVLKQIFKRACSVMAYSDAG